jgi:hypothetical protein
MPTPRSSVPPTTQSALDSAKGILLDVGCGGGKHPNSFGMDIRPLEGVDLVWDFTQTPWPLPDNCAHTVVLSHVWEHIPPEKTLAVMEEIHRVSRDKAGVFISAPYGVGSRYLQDPTHQNPSTQATWAYWDPADPSGLWGVYCPSPFHLQSYQLIPAGGDRDFNAVLAVCKDRRCKKCVPYRVAMADGSALAALPQSAPCPTSTTPPTLTSPTPKPRPRRRPTKPSPTSPRPSKRRSTLTSRRARS